MNKQIDRRSLAKEIHKNAVDKGFWTPKHSVQHYLMLVICELSETVEAHRKDKRANRQAYEARTINGFESKVFELYIKDTLEDELADAYIRLLDFADGFGYEVEGGYEDIDWDRAIVEFRTMSVTEQIFDVLGIIFGYFNDDRLYDHIGFMLCHLEFIARIHDIDLSWHITEKMKYNATRPTLHGKRY